MDNKILKSCSNCRSFWYEAPCSDQPYPEFACTAGHWDGIVSQEDQDELQEETDCKNHKFKKK